MGLPGLTTKQMTEADRIMMEDLGISLELMMEQAGLHYARIALDFYHSYSRVFRIIAGSGSNGGGGLVAARKLNGWGYKTEAVLPRGRDSLRDIPSVQLKRAERVGVTIIDDLETLSPIGSRVVLDSYLGYGFTHRDDEISEHVFEYLRSESNVVSLDVPSGLDSNTGESYSKITPSATVCIAFMKSGLLKSQKNHVGTMYIIDIGVPIDVYLSLLDIPWKSPASTKELELLYAAFAESPIQKVSTSNSYWSIFRG
jgi:NAD(P)H-hydrate epimerase